MKPDRWPIGVFTSIDAGLGVSLDVAADLEIPTIHLHAPHADNRSAETAARFLQRLHSLEIRLTAVFGGFDGESYADIPTVTKTVGLVPESTRARRLAEMKSISDFAGLLSCDVVALHLGFVPHDRESDNYRNIVSTTRELCHYCRQRSQSLHLETGQETATALIQFMDEVACDNLFINFDPANMILYGTGQPLEALRILGPRVRSVHCKDAIWSDRPGETWGREVPLGQGQVDIPGYLQSLREIGYDGPLTIEREISRDRAKQKSEIAHASQLLGSIRESIGKQIQELPQTGAMVHPAMQLVGHGVTVPDPTNIPPRRQQSDKSS